MPTIADAWLTSQPTKWFDENYFLSQKVAQLNVINDQKANAWLAGKNETAWTNALCKEYMAGETFEGQSVSPWINFQACNTSGYTIYANDPNALQAQINVSPNQYFNVPEYLAAVAKFNNEHPGYYTNAAAPEGGWNAQNVLAHMVAEGKTSAWEHYNNQWFHEIKGNDGAVTEIVLINPSNAFDAEHYIASRARAAIVSREQYIQQLRDAGSDPVRDYFDQGKPAGAVQSVAAGSQAEPEAGFSLWGGTIVPPVTPPDPFEVDVTPVDILSDQLVYKDNYEGNTQFNAKWLPSSLDSTLNADDLIIGPAGAMNTLAVTLGNDWGGFNQQTDSDGKAMASVQNVGRVVLDHNPANVEASYNFDATGISGQAYRYDLNGGGPGAISVTNLSDGVKEVRISDIKAAEVGATTPTTLAWAAGAKTKDDDSLTIQLDNVTGGGKNGGAVIVSSKIEDLTIETPSGSSRVDLSQFSNVKTLNLAGDGNIAVTDAATSVREFNASAATGEVSIDVTNPLNTATKIIGGSGQDTVILNNKTWQPPSAESLVNVEKVDINGGGIDLINVNPGVVSADFGANGGYVRNLKADQFNVELAANIDTPGVTVKGVESGLKNITFTTADYAVNNAGTQSAASLTTNATQKVTLTTGENVTKYTVTQFDAREALEVVVNADAIQFGQGSRFDAAQKMTLNLDGTSTASSVMSVDLPHIQNLVINGGDTDFTLSGNLGGTRDRGPVNLDVNQVGDFTVGTIKATLGDNITIDIDANTQDGNVVLGNISNTTNQIGGQQGDIFINVDGATVNSNVALLIDGGPMAINFEDVTGAAGKAADSSFVLDSQGSISYTGAQGTDTVVVRHVSGSGTFDLSTSTASADTLIFSANSIGANTILDITMGAQADTLNFSVGAVGNGDIINVDLGAGTDSMSINAINISKDAKATFNIVAGDGDGDDISVTYAPGCNLRVNFESFDMGTDSVLTFAATNNALQIQAACEYFGIEATGDTFSYGGTGSAAFTDGQNTYAVQASAGGPYTLLCFEGHVGDVTFG